MKISPHSFSDGNSNLITQAYFLPDLLQAEFFIQDSDLKKVKLSATTLNCEDGGGGGGGEGGPFQYFLQSLKRMH